MREAIFYTTSRKVVNTYTDFLPVYTREPLTFSSNSEHMFLKREVGVTHLPIKRFCFRNEDGSIEDRFIVFDQDLSEIIDVMVDDRTRDLHVRYSKIRDATEEFKNQIKHLESRTIWGMIRLKFNRWWSK